MTFSLQYGGFDYEAFFNGAYEDFDSLPALVSTGANSVELTLEYGIDVADSQVVADPNSGSALSTDSLAALGNMIDQAEQLGLSVMVRPLVDFIDPSEIAPYSLYQWRGDYQPSNIGAFFASYKQMIVAEAVVAQQNGAQLLSIGTELDQLAGSQYLSYWTDIINSVRAVFSGKLTYSAYWTDASEVSFWNQLNYEGLDCYVPLSNSPNPSVQTLVNAWTHAPSPTANPELYSIVGNELPIQYFENLSTQSGKPLLFTELGYPNDVNAASYPNAPGITPDPTLQANLYTAFFDAWGQAGASQLVGTYFWYWDPNGSTSNAGPNIDGFSPQNSPAQIAAAEGFASFIAPSVSPIAAAFPWTNNYDVTENYEVTEAVYIGYFGRAGDPAGESYWVSQLTSGSLSSAGMAASFSVQPETLSIYPFLATMAPGSSETVTSPNGWSLSVPTNIYNFINSVYEGLFDRSALGDSNSSGLAYWSAQLAANAGNAQVIGGFILNVISGAQGTDQTTIVNKVTVADYFTQALTSAGVSFTSSADSLAQSAIASVTSNTSTVSAAESTINAWVATQSSAAEVALVGTSHTSAVSSVSHI